MSDLQRLEQIRRQVEGYKRLRRDVGDVSKDVTMADLDAAVASEEWLLDAYAALARQLETALTVLDQQAENYKKLERQLAEAQRLNAAYLRDLDDYGELERDLDMLKHATVPAPEVGTLIDCLACAYRKPWGTWGPHGDAICVECRDYVRNREQAEARLAEIGEDAGHTEEGLGRQ